MQHGAEDEQEAGCGYSMKAGDLAGGEKGEVTGEQTGHGLVSLSHGVSVRNSSLSCPEGEEEGYGWCMGRRGQSGDRKPQSWDIVVLSGIAGRVRSWRMRRSLVHRSALFSL